LPRPRNPDLRTNWKLSMPAPIAARVDLLLLDPLTGKPKYAERSRITAALWEQYLAQLSPSADTANADTVKLLLPKTDHVLFCIGDRLYSYEQLANALEPSQ